MTDFNLPQVDSNYITFPDEIKERDDSIAKMNFATDTNVPDGYIRANAANGDRLERKSGLTYNELSFISEIDAHIANPEIHAVTASGTISMFAGAVAPTGWVFCRGQALSRTTAGNGLELFQAIGLAFGAGDGSTTFNVPDFRQRFPIGKADSGPVATIGASGGQWDHVHSTPNHVHGLPDHTHQFTATFQIPPHSHTVGSHVHQVGPHYHSMIPGNSTLFINGGGTHQHFLETANNSAAGDQRRTINNEGGLFDRFTEQGGEHSHPASTFLGAIGNVNSGNNGDASFDTGNSAPFETASNTTALTTIGQSNTTTSGIDGGPGNTALGGAGITGVSNPPYLTVNFIIKL